MSKKSLEDSYKMCFWSMVLIVVLLIILMLTGCTTTKYVPVPEYHTDTLRITQHQRDSIYVHDSTAVERKDSIIKIEHWHTKYVKKQVHDTLYQSKRDSIPYPVEVVKEVQRPLTKTQIVLMIIGFVCTFLVIAYMGRKIRSLLP